MKQIAASNQSEVPLRLFYLGEPAVYGDALYSDEVLQ